MDPALTPLVRPSTTVYLVVLRDSDMACGDSEKTVAVYVDPTVAALVAETLNEGSRKDRRGILGTFTVVPFELCQAVSETRVRGQVDLILRRYFNQR